MKSIVCYYWNEDPRRPYLPEYVNTLQRAFAKRLPEKHRFVCVADSSKGLSKDVEFVELSAAGRKLASLPSPEGPRFPSCYRRLWTFSEEFGKMFDADEWILTTDVDAVPVADLTPLFDMEGDFVGWYPARDWGRPNKADISYKRFGGGNFLLKPNTKLHVYNDFKGAPSILEARKAKFRGSDQAWISYKLAGTEKCWDRQCGIYSVRDMGPSLDLLPGSRLIHFNGNLKPWHFAQRSFGPGQWVSGYWK